VAFDLRTHADSVGIKINLKNLGAGIRDSMLVNIERFFPNGDSVSFLKKIRAPLFRDSVGFYTLIDFSRGIGLNQIRVTIDYLDRIAEFIESNNRTTLIDLFIPGGDVVPVYPYKYAVIAKTNTLVLKASTTDPFAPLTSYRFELDTSDNFNNPLQVASIKSKGGVIEWTVQLPYGDSTVYYWRVSRDSLNVLAKFAWKESSFQVVGDKHGWGQSHFYQFRNDAYQFVKFKRDQRKFVFENSNHSLECRDGTEPYIGFGTIAYYFNSIKMSEWGCAQGGWNFAIFDSISGEPFKVKSNTFPTAGFGTYNNWVCKDGQVMNFYSFGSIGDGGPYIPSWKTDMENFINAIPPNQYVLAFTIDTRYDSVTPKIPSYSNSLYTAFESLGAKTIRTTPDTVSYILFGRKGMTAGQGHEVVGANQKQIITLQDSIKTRWNSGYIASEMIGPSYRWNSLHWRVRSLENIPGDSTMLKIVGIKQNGQADTLKTFSPDSADINALSSYIDAAIYPYMKLVAFMKDNISRTSPQLKRWHVLYDEAPECAINPLRGFATVNDTLQEGDEVTFTFPIENVGIRNFDDSLVITYWIEDNQRNKTLLPQRLKARPFLPGQVIVDTVRVNSYQLKGNNALWIYANPVANSRYQKEQYQFNNIGRYPFSVTADITNPLLDVTFDGIRILNGDIVSSKPTILVTLKDENRFLALNDTGSFSVFLQQPGQLTQEKIFFANGLQFTPANLPKNSCSILYQPVLPVDGKYTLIVQARDRSKNVSGSQDYRIQFEVDNKPSVTGVMNYPNPFSTSTRFVFTLTGSEIPEVFTIQIMTVTGKVVREITRAELGHIHVGRNITDYAWDGKDNFGDKLGNGVYLYRVVTKLNGENIEKRVSGADKYLVKEFGKMVIMR
jgi:hypothetical protein